MGRKLLVNWGFRRSEDIVWLKQSGGKVEKEGTNTHTDSAYSFTNNLFKSSKEHFLMGIKGTIKRSTDTHFINSNIDTDVIVTNAGSSTYDIPTEIFHIMERLCLGLKRIFIQFDGQQIEKPLEGWLTVKEDCKG